MHLLAEGTVHHGVSFRGVGKQEGEVVQREFLDLAGQNTGIQRDHFNGAALQGRHIGCVAAQHASGEQVDLDLAAGLGGDDLSKLFHSDHDRVTLRVLRGELDGVLAHVLRRGQAESGHSGSSHQRFDHQTFHVVSWKFFKVREQKISRTWRTEHTLQVKNRSQ